jgi:hypothetical protein
MNYSSFPIYGNNFNQLSDILRNNKTIVHPDSNISEVSWVKLKHKLCPR